MLDIPSPKKDEKPQITIQIGGAPGGLEIIEADEPEPPQLPAPVTPALRDDEPTS